MDYESGLQHLTMNISTSTSAHHRFLAPTMLYETNQMKLCFARLHEMLSMVTLQKCIYSFMWSICSKVNNAYEQRLNTEWTKINANIMFNYHLQVEKTIL